MLVLGRKTNERILIGSDIEIVVTRIKDNEVRLGIIAPKSTPIRRTELVRHDQPEAHLPLDDGEAPPR